MPTSFSTLAALRELIATQELPALGPQSRSGVLSVAKLNQALDALFKAGALSADAPPLIRSAILLWHDHLDASHELSQGIETPSGSFLHGIMHRREPDYWNSKYWFRRIGRHPCLPTIAQRVAVLAGDDVGTDSQLVRGGVWDPLAFVDLCEQVASLPAADPRHSRAREIQRVEIDSLLEYFCAPNFSE